MGLAQELDIRVGRRSVMGAGIRRLASTRPGARVFARTLHHLDRWTSRLTGGRTTAAGLLGGVPTLFLTTTGARSGQPRTCPLIAIPSGDDLAVVGSNYGNAKHPGWVHNLDADPHAVVAYRGRRVAVVARELDGAQAEEVWARGREIHPGFATYPAMTSGRRIRAFRLEPAVSG